MEDCAIAYVGNASIYCAACGPRALEGVEESGPVFGSDVTGMAAEVEAPQHCEECHAHLGGFSIIPREMEIDAGCYIDNSSGFYADREVAEKMAAIAGDLFGDSHLRQWATAKIEEAGEEWAHEVQDEIEAAINAGLSVDDGYEVYFGWSEDGAWGLTLFRESAADYIEPEFVDASSIIITYDFHAAQEAIT